MLIIGPAVILNEHLTKALRLLKRASPSSTVDKQVMTNFLLQFLSLPREDTKRYEILNLIASILEWNDEQRQKAGLAKAHSSIGSVRRTNSNPLLVDLPVSPGERKEVRTPRLPTHVHIACLCLRFGICICLGFGGANVAGAEYVGIMDSFSSAGGRVKKWFNG